MKRRARRQGELDALCGLYAIAHFLRDNSLFQGYEEPEESPEKLAFWTVLQATERLDLLSAHYIFYGYEWPELRLILCRVISELELPYRSLPLWHTAQKTGIQDFYTLACRVIQRGGKLICTHSRGNHWVLVKGLDGEKLKIDNSENLAPGDDELTRRQCARIELKDGVVILPNDVPTGAI